MSENQKAPTDINLENKEQKTTEDVSVLTEKDILTSEVSKWKNEYLYMRAEFENYKKNALKERSDLLKYGAERVSRDILDVVDNFERALDLKLTQDNTAQFKQGIEMTAKELKDSLAKHGISEVPSLGLPFNPQFFEAISSEESSDTAEGSVTRVFKKAYKMHDKVIRMGQVVVAIKPKNTNIN